MLYYSERTFQSSTRKKYESRLFLLPLWTKNNFPIWGHFWQHFFLRILEKDEFNLGWCADLWEAKSLEVLTWRYIENWPKNVRRMLLERCLRKGSLSCPQQSLAGLQFKTWCLPCQEMGQIWARDKGIMAVLLSGTKGAPPSKEEFATSLLVRGLRLPDREQTLAGQ